MTKRTSVQFDNSEWERSNGRSPRGRGSWGFAFGDADCDPSEFWFTPGSTTFGEAKKMARVEAQRRGFSGVVFVLA